MPRDADKGEGVKQADQEVLVAIAAFEQILEAMPSDLASLEALAHAYEQIGDLARAKDYLVRLAEALLKEGDAEAARHLVEKLDSYTEQDPEVRELVQRIREAKAAAPPETGAAEGATAERQRRAPGGFSIQDEVSMAWALHEAQQLSAEEYAAVVHDLAEMSSQENAGTVSVLHVLQFRAAKNLERILHYVSRECGTPLIALSSFGLSVESMTLLPLDFMVRRGVLCFGFIGPEALLVVMNPYNRALRDDVEALAGRRCHFFLTLPSEFDATIARIRAQLDEKAAKS